MGDIMNKGIYERVCQNFKDKGCTLLTTEDEHNDMPPNKIRKYRYIASCGHEHKVHYNVFIQRGTGVKCPKCVIIHNGKLKEGDASRTKEGASLKLHGEDVAREFLSSLLRATFEVRKASDGCLADMAIRPKDSEKDEWVMVQIKSSSKQPVMGYSFACGNYPNCVIVCVSMSDKKMWHFNGNEMQIKKISIGLYKSKYDDNYVTSPEHLGSTLCTYMSVLRLVTFDEVDTPSFQNLQKEKEFRVLRETKCNKVPFKYPAYSQLVYDFTIGDFKVQEKSAVLTNKQRKNQVVAITIAKHNGRINKVSKYKSYCQGDNDFYWIHAPDKISFWFIPEAILIEKGFISTSNQAAKTSIHTPKHTWLDAYKLDYDKFDLDKFEAILGKKVTELYSR